MKLTCQAEQLHAAFQIVGSIVQSRPTRPILGDVLLTTDDNGLEIQATDLEIGIRYRLSEVEVREAGQAAVPYVRLHTLVASYAKAEETIELELEGSNCVLKTSDGQFRLPMSPAEEFPALPELEEEGARQIDAGKFKEMVTCTTFAAHRERHRYALNGALLSIKGGVARMVATDGRRLALVEKKTQAEGEGELEVILPTKALDEIVKVAEEDEELSLCLAGEEKGQLVVKTRRAVVATRLVEGHFPPYESVIPKEQDKKLDVEPARLLAAVERAAVMTTEEHLSITVHFAEGQLEVTAEAPDAGAAAVKVPVTYDGKEMEISFNPQFLIEFLRVAEGEQVRMEFTDGTSPVLFRCGRDFLYVVMPVSRQ